VASERISTTEAARRLGVSGTTVRRMVRAGKLHAETAERAQGAYLVVLWDRESEEAPETTTRVATPQPPAVTATPARPVVPQAPKAAAAPAATAPRLPSTGTGGLLAQLASTSLSGWALALIVLAAVGLSASGLVAYRHSR
jgi:hypothetical protein